MAYAFLGLILLLAIVAPFALIWALNALFLLGIPYTLKTWAAALVITIFIGSNKTRD